VTATAPPPAPAPARATAPAERRHTIAVGQSWTDAEQSAARAGYRRHDAAGLAWQPPIDGFYVRLAGDRDLIVFRDADTDSVAALTLVESASKPKSLRTLHAMRWFDLPPAREHGG
jgi:hypothetical protein